jgi:hypothetical protein
LRSSTARAPRTAEARRFFDVFARRDPGKVRFDEAKTSGDSPKKSQRKLVKLALDFGHRLESSRSSRSPKTI